MGGCTPQPLRLRWPEPAPKERSTRRPVARSLGHSPVDEVDPGRCRKAEVLQGVVELPLLAAL